jgi:hypothetical protein
MAPNFKTAFLSMALFCAGANGQVPPEKRAELKIEKFQATSYGFEVTVSVKNTGAARLVLGESGEAKETLQSLGVQQWDDKLGWQSVGSCRDVPPASTVRLEPGESLHNIVRIGDRAHGWTSTVCTGGIEHLGGKVRATLSYAFDSEQDFRKRNPKGRVDFVSIPVELPRTTLR